jgi:hypothetical protein
LRREREREVVAIDLERCCMRDEGRPLAVVLQEEAANVCHER